MVKMKGKYPEDWPEIAERIKKRNNYRCEVCRHPHDPPAGYCLTVHHLDRDPENNEDWNLASACQRCHLRLEAQAKWLEKRGVTVFSDKMFVYEKLMQLPLWERECLKWEKVSVSLDVKFAKWFRPHWKGYLVWREG